MQTRKESVKKNDLQKPAPQLMSATVILLFYKFKKYEARNLKEKDFWNY